MSQPTGADGGSRKDNMTIDRRWGIQKKSTVVSKKVSEFDYMTKHTPKNDMLSVIFRDGSDMIKPPGGLHLPAVGSVDLLHPSRGHSQGPPSRGPLFPPEIC